MSTEETRVTELETKLALLEAEHARLVTKTTELDAEQASLLGRLSLADGNSRLKDIDRTINKIMGSKLPAETKVEMIKVQQQKKKAILEASK